MIEGRLDGFAFDRLFSDPRRGHRHIRDVTSKWYMPPIVYCHHIEHLERSIFGDLELAYMGLQGVSIQIDIVAQHVEIIQVSNSVLPLEYH